MNSLFVRVSRYRLPPKHIASTAMTKEVLKYMYVIYVLRVCVAKFNVPPARRRADRLKPWKEENR